MDFMSLMLTSRGWKAEVGSIPWSFLHSVISGRVVLQWSELLSELSDRWPLRLSSER